MTDLILARRAVACSGWGWRPGMLVFGGDRITERTLGIVRGCVPDLHDDATRGCLLALVREAWSDRLVTTLAHAGEDATDPPTWDVWRPLRYGSQTIGSGPTEAEALITALESAPEKGTT